MELPKSDQYQQTQTADKYTCGLGYIQIKKKTGHGMRWYIVQFSYHCVDSVTLIQHLCIYRRNFFFLSLDCNMRTGQDRPEHHNTDNLTAPQDASNTYAQVARVQSCVNHIE